MPVVVLLAAARAVTPVLALDGGPGLALVLLPLAGASAVWLVLAAVLKRSGPLGRESGSSSPLHPRVAGRTDTGSPGLLRGGRGKSAILLTAVAFAVISALLVVLPLWYGSAVGLLAVMMTSFTGLAALFATISIWIQRVAPPRLFQVMALRRTPAVTLLVLVAIITNLFAVSSPHDVRTPSAAANTAALGRWRSTTWEAAVTNWLGGTAGPDTAAGGRTCTPPRTSVDDAGPHAGPITVRPMVFLALEGGGMRAAYWAADFLKGVLANRCLADDVVAVSSVSGGSVGLATVEAVGDGALGAVRRMAGQDGLSATVGALLTRDLLAGSYGIDVTAPHQDYLDRAALLAAAWQRAVPSAAPSAPEPLASSYPLGAFSGWGDGSAGTAKVPWVSVFNATSALNGCVVTMSTVDLGVPPGADPRSSCGAGQLPASYQLFAKDPRYAGLPLIDAALLSARFGVISPSGVLRTDRGDVADQLIDGGYAENTGLATVDGLLSSAIPLVRAHNAAELAAPGATTDLVVPVVIALSNDPTALARDAKPAKPTDELTLPLTSRLRAGAALVSPEALKTRAAAIVGGYLPPIADPGRAKQISLAVGRTVWHPVITLAPTAQPGVAVPLGWALSSTTMTAMDDALRCITRDPIYSAGRPTPACARSADQEDNDAFVHLSGAVR